MRKVFIFYLMVNCLMKVEGLWGQCANSPRVVRIQADACGILERETEFFQFVTGKSFYDLGANVTSIDVDGLLSRSAWTSVSQALLDGLNLKYAPCSSGPVFIDPYKSPYFGNIPPNSVVIAFTDINPMADALKSSLKTPQTLCGKAPIFVIKSSANNVVAVFSNQINCPFSCPKTINVQFGNCSRQYPFDANKLDGTTGAYLEVDSLGNVAYKVSDGCYPFALTCIKPKFTPANLSALTCAGVGFQLPKISDITTGNAMYFTKPGRKGIAYSELRVLFDTITLYANDYNNCDSANTSIDTLFFVNLKLSPKIDSSFLRIDLACGFYVLPDITGVNLTNNRKYTSDSLGTGASFKPGDTIRSSMILYAFDQNTGCFDSKRLTINFRNAPSINNPKDTLVPCGKTFLLPIITGTNLFSAGYHTAPNKGGLAPAFGTPVLSKTTFYLYDQFRNCIDEDTFTVSLAPTIILPKDTFRNDTFCNTFTLPGGGIGVTLKYFDTFFNSYSPGDIINTTTKLYYQASIPGCNLPLDSMTVLLRKLLINNITIPRQCNPVLDSLPVIIGTNLTGNVAFYSDSLGKGKRYKTGDSVHAFKPNFFFADRQLYAYEEAQYHYEKCISKSVLVTIPFFAVVETDPIPDVSLKCNQPFITPQIIPSVFANQSIYSLPNKQGTQYKPGDLISQTGTYYTHSERLTCFDEDTFKVTITPNPVYSNNINITACDSMRLPKINGVNIKSDSTFYSTLSFGKGTTYAQGSKIMQSGKFYIFDKSQVCQVQDSIQVLINTTPDLQVPDRLEGCDSIQLVTNSGFPDLRYYSQSGLKGQMQLPLSFTRTNGDIFAISGIPGCFDEDTIKLNILIRPVLIPMRDTTLCNELILPKIQGKNLTGTERYHEFTDAMGETYYGDGRYFIGKTMTLFVWDSDNDKKCWDEDTFNITILPKPVIDSIPAVKSCETFSLPIPSGQNLSAATYFDAAGGKGNELRPGNKITTSQRLYMYQPSAYCPAEQALDISIKDSTTSDFIISPFITCATNPIDLTHIGKKSLGTSYDWSIIGSSTAFTNQPNQTIKLDTGSYKITLQARANECFGPPKSQSVRVIPPLPPIKNLTCVEDTNRLVFAWDPLPGVTDFITAVLQGPTGIRTTNSIIFNNLTLGERVTINVLANSAIPCANGPVSMLSCKTKFCPSLTVKITDEAPFCSGDAPLEPVVQIIGLSPADTVGLKRIWSGPGMLRDTFFPSIAGPGNHTIKFTLITNDSCIFSDTAVFVVGTGSVIILNDKAVECAPPSQRQFNIRMVITTPNTPYLVHYTYRGTVSSIFQSSVANFTLSASFGLIGDSITIDSIVDSKGCKMLITSMAGTRTFKAVQFISIRDTTSTCDFITKTYQYKIRIRNVNTNDPLNILSGGGTIQDSFYISPSIPFNTRHQAVVTHKNNCDTLAWDLMIPCTCTPIVDTQRSVACENDVITIRGKMYTINKSTGIDTLLSVIPGTCDTIRNVAIQFIRNPISFLRTSVCPADMIKVGTTIFDKTRPTGIVRLPKAAASGCDSLVDVALDFKLPAVRFIKDTICAGDSVRLGGILFNLNHTRDSVKFINQAANGCDSIVYYDVLVESVKASVLKESVGCTASVGKSLIISTVTGGSSPYSYAFNNGAYNQIQSLPTRINSLPSDTFTLHIKSLSGCLIDLPVGFPVFASGLKLNLGPDKTIKIGDTVQLRINANFTISSYHWITQDYLSCINCLNPVAQPLKSTIYIVEALDANGCLARDTLRLLVDPEVNIYVPSILHPNSTLDENHVLNIYPASQIAAIQRFTIYDRWGTTVVDIKNPALTTSMPVWDGTFKGSDAPGAVYVYKMIYETIDGQSKVKYGDITVIR